MAKSFRTGLTSHGRLTNILLMEKKKKKENRVAVGGRFTKRLLCSQSFLFRRYNQAATRFLSLAQSGCGSRKKRFRSHSYTKHVCLQLNDGGGGVATVICVSDCSDLLDSSVTREVAALLELSAK